MWSGDDSGKGEVAQPHDGSDPVDTEMSDSSPEDSQDRRQQRCRERSLSVPCRSETTQLDSVMTKAKRASSYLWMLLHSQSCRLGVDRCTHAGCANAKLVHLHLKTCPAGLDFPCPTRYEGCLQARKLLTHYRRCRNVRARQVGAPSLKGQHVCLICSMVARQARSLLDNNLQASNSKASGQQVVPHKKSSNNPKCQVTASFTVKTSLGGVTQPLKKEADCERKFLTTFTFSNDNDAATFFKSKGDRNPAGDWDMPPPAPRPMVSKSAPVSPSRNCDRQELKGKAGEPLKQMPLIRKRSESLGSSPAISRRAVSFAESPEFVEHRPLAVDLTESGEPGRSRRVRSASCHLLTATGSPSETCGTIYEELGPAASYMDE